MSGSNIGPVVAGVLSVLCVVTTVIVCLVRRYQIKRGDYYRGGDMVPIRVIRSDRVGPADIARHNIALARMHVLNHGWGNIGFELEG